MCKPLILAFMAASLNAQIYSDAANFTADLQGATDTRPDCWGTTDATSWPIKFTVPVGYRVRILAIKGDLLSWAKSLPGDAPVSQDSTAGVLLGFQSTAQDGSQRCYPCASNTMVYLQDAVDGRHKTRTPYDYTIQAGGLLQPDNVLLVKVASWLNTTGHAIHIEPTFVVTYTFEAIQ